MNHTRGERVYFTTDDQPLGPKSNCGFVQAWGKQVNSKTAILQTKNDDDHTMIIRKMMVLQLF